MSDAERRTGPIELIAASSNEAPIMANLLELYAYDFSEFHDLELGPDGRFGYAQLPLYWLEQNRRPFLVRVGGQLSGLVLVKQGSEISGDGSVWDMAEFFIVRRYRRRGVGTRIAHHLWRTLSGRWEIRVMETNAAAHRFWQHALAQFLSAPVDSVQVKKGSRTWRLFSFETGDIPR